MPRFPTIIFLFVVLLGCEAPPPDVCMTLSTDPLEMPLSFKTYEADGCTVEEWREALDAHVRGAVGLGKVSETSKWGPLPDVFSWRSERTQHTVESEYDGSEVPYYVVEPDPDVTPRDHVVMILHGHGEDWDAAFDEDSQLHDLGGILVEEGYTVVVPGIRSFDEFEIGGLDHEEYVALLPPGVFMGQIIADTASVTAAVFERYEGQPIRVSVVGHSLGGYLSLHVGALTRKFDKVMTNGSFMPYGCVNTSVHCHCEHLPDMYGIAELYDVAGMVAPETSVDVLFGARDGSLSLASIQMYDELVYIFDKTGAPTTPGFHLTFKNAHEVDPEKVLEILEDG